MVAHLSRRPPESVKLSRGFEGRFRTGAVTQSQTAVSFGVGTLKYIRSVDLRQGVFQMWCVSRRIRVMTLLGVVAFDTQLVSLTSLPGFITTSRAG
jgi:hypothetical protein